MGQFDNLFACSVGSTSFQLENYSLDIKPIITPNVGRTGSTVSVKGKGWIESITAEELGAAIQALPGAYATSGQTFTIQSLGGVTEYELDPGQCIDGGPYLALTIGEQSQALLKPISFEVTATTLATIQIWFTQTVSTRPDGLLAVERQGTAIDDSLGVAEQLALFTAAYPASGWVVSYKSSSSSIGSTSTFTFTAQQLAAPYPSGSGSADAIVDGEGSVRRERDEQMRLATTYDFDLLVKGNAETIANNLRALAIDDEQSYSASGSGGGSGDPDASIVLRESVSVTMYREVRIRASFSFVRGGDGTQLLNWTQTLDLVDDNDAYRIQEYIGTDAVLIEQPDTMQRIVQSGSATGLGAFPKPPDPIISDAYIERPEITCVAVDVLECQTTWRYVMASDDEFDMEDYVDDLVRPSSPSFYGAA